jgi:hypothetical protein
MIRQIAARVCEGSAMTAAAVRILRALHAALGRWLTLADVPEVKRKRTSWFDCDSDTLHAALPSDPDQEEADAWARAHFRINGQPLP